MFHHALPVTDLARTRAFYAELLGCGEGKATDERINFDFFGNHLVAHLVDAQTAEAHHQSQKGRRVAWRHFGVILDWSQWEALAERLTKKGVSFLLEPQVRHAGEPREEALMFLLDPSGNGVEFKTFRDAKYAFQNG
jgi:hypothetical protein